MIEYKKNGSIAYVTFNRIEKKNAITNSMYQDLVEFFNDAKNDESITVLTIRGDEECFTSGNDLADFLNGELSLESPVVKFLHSLATFDKILVAAVAGSAVGIGTTMLFHCDFVYAKSNSKFQMPFVNLGLCPEAGVSYLLPKLAGDKVANELLMYGDFFDVKLAKEIKLINEVVENESLIDFVDKKIAQLIKRPKDSLLLTKKLIKGSYQELLKSKIDEEAKAFFQRLSSNDAKNAFNAFLNKK